ncbi:unnamed protein product, partial [Lepidochelys olivacea]
MPGADGTRGEPIRSQRSETMGLVYIGSLAVGGVERRETQRSRGRAGTRFARSWREMEVLRRLLGRKTPRVAPEPEGGSCQHPQTESCPSIPMEWEAAPGQPRRWTCSALLTRRKPAPRAGAEQRNTTARPRWRWPKFSLGRQDPGHERSQAMQLWVCFCWKASPQEPSPVDQQEASPGQDRCPSSSTGAGGESGHSLEAPWSMEAECSSTAETPMDQLEKKDLATEEKAEEDEDPATEGEEEEEELETEEEEKQEEEVLTTEKEEEEDLAIEEDKDMTKEEVLDTEEKLEEEDIPVKEEKEEDEKLSAEEEEEEEEKEKNMSAEEIGEEKEDENLSAEEEKEEEEEKLSAEEEEENFPPEEEEDLSV